MNPRRMRAGQQSPPCEPSAASVGRGPRAGGRLPADAARGEASFLLTESITPARRLSRGLRSPWLIVIWSAKDCRGDPGCGFAAAERD